MSASTPRHLGTRSFTQADQLHFAALTHDRNPMHVDPLAARRTQFGAPVVHGVHTLLWSLDLLCAARPGLPAGGLQVRFTKPVLVGDTVTAAITAEKPGEITLQIAVDRVACATIRLTEAAPRGLPEPIATAEAPLPSPIRDVAQEVALDAMTTCHGAIKFDGTAVAAAFPAAAAAIGRQAVIGLAAATYVVGMECPGLHSIFAGITARLGGQVGPEPVRFSVAKFDPRFRMMDIALLASGFTARLHVYGRVPPVAQPATKHLSALVSPGAFAGQRALVIGGSRGLGEVTAKLLAAGGAEVVLSYARGAEDAHCVAADITAAGGHASTLAYDVQQPPEAQLAALGIDVNALYYFATGTIYRRRAALYEPALMAEFTTFYVQGFHDLAMELKQRAKSGLVAFYPSTIFAAEPTKNFAEYGAAKLAGEMICGHLSAFAGIETVVSRLPRTRTDQTATVTETDNGVPAEVMLPLLHQMQMKISRLPSFRSDVE